ncbi:MAG: AEC family transporter [Alphaproteobacteria bacterium]|nr:AEC family transporter [Alphaproteobacteria bacterium]
MDAVVDVVLPVFAIMAAGFGAGRARLLGPAASEALNGFVYWFALPPLLFAAMARVPVAEVFHLPFLAAFGGAFLATYALGTAAGRLFAPPDLARQGLQGLAASFANTGYMGLPLYLTAFGTGRALPAVVATVFNAAVAMALAVAVTEIGRRDRDGGRVVRDVARALATNPLLLAPAAGLAVSAAGLALPRPVATFCDLMGATAGPGALFAIGLFMVGKPLAGGRGELAWIVLCKLVLQPLLAAWLAFRVFPMEREWAVAAVLMSALPTGALAFVIALRYGVYVAGTSSAILATTAVSFITLSVALSLLR